MSANRKVPDETLCAYLDGELAPAEHAELEQEIARDPALRERLERFQGVMALMQQEFVGPADEPVPESLLVAARHLADARNTASNVVPLAPRQSVPSAARWQLPIAAAVALAIGGVLGGAVQAWRGEGETALQVATLDAALIVPANPLHAALEQTPSGETVTAGDNRLHMVLSFAAKDGRYCREFDVAAKGAASVGVACRDNGAWRLEVLLAAKPPEDGAYQPASGYNTKAFDDVVSALMKDAPLDKAMERDLIARNWR
jgi:negative regulator of sigma E activity